MKNTENKNKNEMWRMKYLENVLKMKGQHHPEKENGGEAWFKVNTRKSNNG